MAERSLAPSAPAAEDARMLLAQRAKHAVGAEASGTAISALNLDEAIEAILHLAVPRMAAVAEIHLATNEGVLGGEPSVIHADRNREIRLKEMHRRYPIVSPRHPVLDVYRCGRAQHFEWTPELVACVTTDPEHRGMIEALRIKSSAVLPLRARGEILGILSFGAADRLFTADDMVDLEDVSQRAALAIDNAMLFRIAEVERRRVEEAHQARENFLAMVSHELRTPLTTILGWARMLRSGSLIDEEREKALAIIERNATIQTRIIEDLLDIGRIITGKIELHVSAVDIVRIVETVVETSRPAARAKGLHLHLTLDENIPRLSGDADRIRQIVSNLVGNAVKFTPRGGSIQIELRTKAAHVEIRVDDTGTGIPDEFLPFVFDGFRQASAGTTRSHGGLGVGLAIVRKLVELHGGTVHAQSAGTGQGARFWVCLPIAGVESTGCPPLDPSRSSSPPPEAVRAPDKLDSLHVLVVDDDLDARDLLAAVLEHGQVKVTTASTAAEALQILPRLRPHVLVSDIGMPIEDGYALIEKVRALAPEQGGRTPAVALTAYARWEDRTRALLAGFNVHIPKPIDPVELLSVVTNLGGQSRNQ